MSTVAAAFRPPHSQEELSERDVRIQLAACYRLIAHFGMDDLVFTPYLGARAGRATSISSSIPTACMFSEITASSLVKIDLDGNSSRTAAIR